MSLGERSREKKTGEERRGEERRGEDREKKRRGEERREAKSIVVRKEVEERRGEERRRIDVDTIGKLDLDFFPLLYHSCRYFCNQNCQQLSYSHFSLHVLCAGVSSRVWCLVLFLSGRYK